MKTIIIILTLLASFPSFAKVSCDDLDNTLEGKYTVAYSDYKPSLGKVVVSDQGIRKFVKTSRFHYAVTALFMGKTVVTEYVLGTDEDGVCYIVTDQENEIYSEVLEVSSNGEKIVVGDQDEDERYIFTKMD